MKNIVVAVLVTFFSCKSNLSNNEDKGVQSQTHQSTDSLNYISKQEYKNVDGTYKLEGNNDCNLIITLKNNNYVLKSTKRTNSGEFEVLEEKDVLISFKNLYGDDPREQFYAKYENESLFIQNYGNSMNQFTRISECSSKYLILKKQ